MIKKRRKHALLGSHRLYALNREFKNKVWGWRDKWYYLVFGISRKNQMPDFIIAGLPKTGTWWLNKVLETHPNIELVTELEKGKGELRFFSFRFDWPIRAYFKLFQNKKPDVLYFEKSPDYSIISKSRMRLMKALNPELKIILMFRHPVEWAFSHAKMDLVRDKNKKFEEVPDTRFFHHYQKDALQYNYQIIAQRYESVFGDNALILDFEEIKNQPEALLKKVADFIGFDQDKVDKSKAFQKVNTTETIPLPSTHKEVIEKAYENHIKFYESYFSSDSETDPLQHT